MLDISPAGLLGAALGTVLAAVAYVPLAAAVGRGLRTRPRTGQTGEPDAAPRGGLERALLLRLVLAADIVVFAGLGYWLGAAIGG
jgi:hypothetical protein